VLICPVINLESCYIIQAVTQAQAHTQRLISMSHSAARHGTAQRSAAQHSTGVKGLSDMRTLNSIDRIESVCRYCSKS
jgi:hypothetical protein